MCTALRMEPAFFKMFHFLALYFLPPIHPCFAPRFAPEGVRSCIQILWLGSPLYGLRQNYPRSIGCSVAFFKSGFKLCQVIVLASLRVCPSSPCSLNLEDTENDGNSTPGFLMHGGHARPGRPAAGPTWTKIVDLSTLQGHSWPRDPSRSTGLVL